MSSGKTNVQLHGMSVNTDNRTGTSEVFFSDINVDLNSMTKPKIY